MPLSPPTLVLNYAPAVRTEWKDGREYRVAPLATIVPGVLHGSQGALYYPPDQAARNTAAWDGVPLTVYHPADPLTNAPTSASAPGVLERQGIGHVAASRFERGKLRHEGWFDVERVRAADAALARNGRPEAQILPRLERGEPIELSTGLFTDNVEAPPGARCPATGRPYTHVATNYRPDHMAVLPDQVGACSLADGCGVNVVNTDGGPMLVTNAAFDAGTDAGPGATDGPVANAAGCAELVATLLHAATAAHMLHLGTRSLAAHLALDELYKGLPGLTDALAEAYQGKAGALLGPYPAGFTPPAQDPEQFVAGLGAWLAGARAALGPDSELQNLADEVAALLDTTAYKLRFLR